MNKLISSIISLFVELFISVSSRSRLLSKAAALISEKLVLVRYVEDKKRRHRYGFHTPNRMTYWRTETYFDKEPETLEWIDGFSADDVFYDIGGNIGVYTIFAGVNNKAGKIFTFEPESLNYALLNRNVFLNGLSEKVSCFNIALSDSVKLDYLYLSELNIGAAVHNFGSANEGSMVSLKQGAVSYSLDEFIKTFNPDFPNHIKIDVDGLEEKIIEGAKNTLADSRLKSLLIEIDEGANDSMRLVKKIEASGLKLEYKKHSPMFDGGPYKNVYNYIFSRAN